MFDVGQNVNATNPSPLQANMQQLDIRSDDMQIIAILYYHPYRTGGVNWWSAGTCLLDNQQLDLEGKLFYVSTALCSPCSGTTGICRL